MASNSTTAVTPQPEVYDKSTPGRGYVVVIYGLYIGSIIAVVTAPIGMAIAFFRLDRGAPWLDTHLVFQLRTFWLGVLAAATALLVWQLAGYWELRPVYAWAFGYLFFTAANNWKQAPGCEALIAAYIFRDASGLSDVQSRRV